MTAGGWPARRFAGVRRGGQRAVEVTMGEQQRSAREKLCGTTGEHEFSKSPLVDGGNGDVLRQHLSAETVLDVLALPLGGTRHDPHLDSATKVFFHYVYAWRLNCRPSLSSSLH